MPGFDQVPGPHRVHRPSRSGVRFAAAGGLVGPAAFITAWALLGERAPDYSPAHDAISRLASDGAPTRAAMTAGLVVFGTGLPLSAIAFRAALPGPAWVLATATGVATLGVAAFPLGSPTRDAVHGAFAGVAYATVAALPWAAAAPLARAGRRHWAILSRTAAVVSGSCLLATIAGPVHGMFQRIGLTVADAWVMAMAADILRRDSR